MLKSRLLSSNPVSNHDDEQSRVAKITGLHAYPISHDYIKKLFKWIIIWAILAIAFIWIVDPYGVSPIKVSLHRFNANKPKRLDIDRLIKPFEVWRYQPKTIFIGTSRMHQSMDPSVFDGTKYAPAYNAAIPASTLAVNVAHIEQFIKLDPNLKHIFMELFLYNFAMDLAEEPPKSWGQFFSDNASLQASTDALFDSIKTIGNNIVKSKVIPAHITERGYKVPGSDFNPGTTFTEALYINNVVKANINKMRLTPTSIETLDRIVALTRKHGIQLHLFMTPNYPWDDYRLIALGYWPMEEAWMRKMSVYADVISFSQYNSWLEEEPLLEPQMKWWNDPLHFSLNMGRKMLHAYLGHPDPDSPKNLMRRLNTKTVEAVIAERRNGAMKWAAAHPDFVSDFQEAMIYSSEINGTLDIKSKSLIINGKKYPIVIGVGEISNISDNGSTLTASGWAIDEVAKRHPSLLVATIGETVVSRGLATVKRAGIELAVDKHAVTSGFNIDIPLQTWDKSKPIRVFALMADGRAIQIPSQLKPINSFPIATLDRYSRDSSSNH